MVKAGHFIKMSSHAEMMDSVLNTAKLAGVVAKLWASVSDGFVSNLGQR
jgi:hypothetical protein